MGIKSLKWRRAKKVTAFDNARTEEHGVHYSRYIASWLNVGGKNPTTLEGYTSFCMWLESLGLTEDEVYNIGRMAMCGKIELEESAEAFIGKSQEEL